MKKNIIIITQSILIGVLLLSTLGFWFLNKLNLGDNLRVNNFTYEFIGFNCRMLNQERVEELRAFYSSASKQLHSLNLDYEIPYQVGFQVLDEHMEMWDE